METRIALKIFLLGGFKAEVKGKPVSPSVWRKRKARLLVAILALERSQQMHREQLTEMLFPDSEQDAANANFYRLVYEARRALEPALSAGQKPRFLIYEGKQIRLMDSGIAWVDAVEFEHSARLGLRQKDTMALEHAAELYSGDLLTDEPHEEWTHAPRERLRHLFHTVLRQLADDAENRGDVTQAHLWIDRTLEFEPADEAAHRAKMRLYHCQGDRTLALKQYETCKRVLARELAVRPEPETELLRQKISRPRK